MKHCILTIILISGIAVLTAQEVFVGFHNGIILSSVSFKYQDSFQYESYSFGLFAEYTPPKALFSITSELQYLFEGKTLIVPTSLNFILGNRVRPRIIGGLVPVFRLKPEYPDVVFGIGVNYGFGLDIKVASKFAIHSQLVWYRLPYKSIYDKYNYNEIDTNWWPSVMFKLGVSYKIKIPVHNNM